MALVTKSFSDIITFTRASTATYFDATGTLQSAAIDAPRFDYNPSTLAAQGLLIEEQRTNSIRNNTMQGAVAGTPGTLPTNWSSALQGLSQTIVGTGVEKGITYIDIRFFGITTSATAVNVRFEPQGVVSCSNGQTWAPSIWISLISGSFTGITARGFSANIFDSVGAYLSDINFGALGTITSSFQRLTPNPHTISQVGAASLRPYIFFSHPGIGTSLDFTLRIGLPQLEQGAFATSVIPTTTTALTRSADVASVNTLSPWYNATSGTLYAEVQHYAPSVAVQQWQAQLASTSADYYGIYKETSPAYIATRVRSGGVDQAFAYTTGAISANTTYKTALGYAVNDVASCTNGGTVFTDATVTLPTSITALGLGQPTYTTAVMLNGYLRRIVYYPRRLSNAELHSITS